MQGFLRCDSRTRIPELRKSCEICRKRAARAAAGQPVAEIVAPARLALAVGNEGAGLSSSVRERATQLVSLPISASVESLNVAVAAGILLYQLSK